MTATIPGHPVHSSWLDKIFDALVVEKNVEPPTLAEFVQVTTGHTLDHWQMDLCKRLETLKDQRGQRLLVHAPPQMGKSILVSQRFPAWLLGQLPNERIKLACYGIEHATKFSKVVRDLMADPSSSYEKMFPGVKVSGGMACRAEEWSTVQRAALRDGQPSFKALGLHTGFVGQGADTLIVDDPYASPQDAYSVAIRKSVEIFYDAAASTRLSEDANVIVMFHRYHLDDIASYLYAQGGWTLLRYAAQADGDPTMPDPIGREPGEYLSPRRPAEWYEDRKKLNAIWMGQFQGKPVTSGGGFFQPEHMTVYEQAPPVLKKVRAWDLAASLLGDHTVGLLMGRDIHGMWGVLDVVRGRWLPHERDRIMEETAKKDGTGVQIVIPQDPGQAGLDQAKRLQRMFAGYKVKSVRPSGSKADRASGVASQLNSGNIWMVKAPWNFAFTAELEAFDPVVKGQSDDQIDTLADAFNEMSTKRQLAWA